MFWAALLTVSYLMPLKAQMLCHISYSGSQSLIYMLLVVHKMISGGMWVHVCYIDNYVIHVREKT